VEVSVSKDADSGAELISVEEVNAPRSKGNEFILRHITKFQEIVRDLNSPALAGTARTAGVAAYWLNWSAGCPRTLTCNSHGIWRLYKFRTCWLGYISLQSCSAWLVLI